jgi:hypothetical protein
VIAKAVDLNVFGVRPGLLQVLFGGGLIISGGPLMTVWRA